MRRRTRARAGRSNLYSESRFTNWAPYDPQRSEMNRSESGRPAALFPTNDGEQIHLYALPLHKDFVRPFDCADVIEILKLIPQKMLRGLTSIALLGGSKRQARVANSGLWSYGRYRPTRIYLCAYPRSQMQWTTQHLSFPSARLAYLRAGVTVTHRSGSWHLEFTDESLRRFYLWDVLIHEIGHHVDRFHRDQSTSRAERFAEWFARTYGFESAEYRRITSANANC